MDFSTVKIRCSSLGYLFTEPKDAAAKKAGELSKTAKTHLIEIYARELWGVEKDIVTPAMKKGITCEEEAFALLSRLDRKLYTKNQERLENSWLSGHPDIRHGDTITDTKVSWDAFTFLPKLMEPIEKIYEYQLQGYMWLDDKIKGRISYCLVDTPENIIQGECYKLLRSMDVVSEESPEYVAAAKKLISNMKFSHLPMHQRVIHHYTERNQEIIDQIPEKVTKAREFLAQFYEKHMNLYPKQEKQVA